MSSCDNSSALVPHDASQPALLDGWMDKSVSGGKSSSRFGAYEHLIFVLRGNHDFWLFFMSNCPVCILSLVVVWLSTSELCNDHAITEFDADLLKLCVHLYTVAYIVHLLLCGCCCFVSSYSIVFVPSANLVLPTIYFQLLLDYFEVLPVSHCLFSRYIFTWLFRSVNFDIMTSLAIAVVNDSIYWELMSRSCFFVFVHFAYTWCYLSS